MSHGVGARRTRIVGGLGMLTVVLCGGVLAAFAPPAGAGTRKGCDGDLDEYKIEGNPLQGLHFGESRNYVVDGETFTLTKVHGEKAYDEVSFDFASTVDVLLVDVKGGDDTNTSGCNDGERKGHGLHTKPDHNGKVPDITRVTFCTKHHSATTTTVKPTTTSLKPTSTTVAPTSTTVAPTTSTTLAPTTSTTLAPPTTTTDEPTTTTIAAATTTTTEAPTTTTVAPTTTTVAPTTTTTEEPTTSTTVAPETSTTVEPETTTTVPADTTTTVPDGSTTTTTVATEGWTVPSSSATTSTVHAAASTSPTTGRAAPSMATTSTLPFTGGDSAGMGWFAVALITAGLLLVRGAARRHRRQQLP